MALSGKVAIVTGCASGIGLATTRLFLEAGAVVFGIDISPFPRPSPLSESFSGQFHFHRVDLTAPGAAEESLTTCLSKVTEKRVDILANVAGVMDSFEGADTITDEAWSRNLSINTTVPLKLARAVLTQGGMMERKQGRIINVSSKAGIGGGAAGIAYTASKHALVGITKHIAWRYHNHGIRCNAVCPGGVTTNIGASINKDRLDATAFETIKPFHELHHSPDGSRSITTDDIANAILFLATEQSQSINGVILPVDNAWSAL